VSYVSQLDEHIPFLKVRETLQFACDNANAEPALLGSSELAASQANRVDQTIRMLGLENCADTVVGNELLRGVSGGEKKRVSGRHLLIYPRTCLG
jgi:ABC-type multidrug transport system ATPase subunit